MQISREHEKLLMDHVMPWGRILEVGADNINAVWSPTRRFLFDSSQARRSLKSRKLVDPRRFDPRYTGLGINEALGNLIQVNYGLYALMFEKLRELDDSVRPYFAECSQAAVLFCHTAFGERLFPHVHAAADTPLPSLSVFTNLTRRDSKNPILRVQKELPDDSTLLASGYTDHRRLLANERRVPQEAVEVKDGDRLLFNASHIPHSFTYTDDLWMVIVYDNVTTVSASHDFRTLPD